MVATGLYSLVWAGDTQADRKGDKSKQVGKTQSSVNTLSQKTRSEKAPENLVWVDYGTALERAKTENKHVLVDFYTSWCGWCKVMDRKTYTDASVMNALNENFILARVNAESGKQFEVGKTRMSGRQVAREFGVSSFPMTWFLKPDGSRLVNIAGYVPAEKFITALEYVGERQYEGATEGE